MSIIILIRELNGKRGGGLQTTAVGERIRAPRWPAAQGGRQSVRRCCLPAAPVWPAVSADPAVLQFPPAPLQGRGKSGTRFRPLPEPPFIDPTQV
jgi:hypothetical protein